MSLFSNKIIVIVPAYNEEGSIFYVVNKLYRHYPDITVVVVNDGSKDRTAEYARSAGATVLSLTHNLGIGGAVQTGYLYALKHGFDIAVQMDADGQHKIEELPKIINPLIRGEADLILGSRFVKKTAYQSSRGRRIGIKILSILVSMMARQPLKDVTSGFRAINRKGIELCSHHYSTDYPEVDSLVYLKSKGLRIKEVSVQMEPRMAGNSSITSLKSIYYMLKVSLTLMMTRFQ